MKNSGVFAKIIIIISALAFVAAGVFMIVDGSRYRTLGIKTQATITSISYESGVDEDERIVTVEFEADGKIIDGRLNVYSSGMKKGDKVTIYYMPDNPNDFGCVSYNFIGVFLCFTAAAVIIGFCVFPVISEAVYSSKLKRLKSCGNKITAKICQVTETGTRINGVNVVKIVCMTPDGGEFTRKVKDGKTYAVGDDIAVYVDKTRGKYMVDTNDYESSRSTEFSQKE